MVISAAKSSFAVPTISKLQRIFSSIIKKRECTQKSSVSTHTSPDNKSSSEYCMETVRKFDYENFLSSLLYPESVRTTSFAVRAFNIELAQIRDVVSDKQRGLMRMQFWKDTLNQIYQGVPPKSPIAMELHRVIQRHNLTKQWFTRLIEARAEHLDKDRFQKLSEVEEYADRSVSPVLYILLESLGIKNVHADHAASHIGRSQGLVTLLRSTPFHASQGRVYFPIELLVKHDVSEEDVLRRKQTKGLTDLVYDVACSANQHLDTARKLKKDVPKEAIIVFLNTVMCEWYLKKIQKVDFDPFHPSLQHRNALLPLHLWLQKFRRTY
ncbi:hypothetical protein ScPMuIL_001939 [Solemya velum]